jgi:long-chain acyl-CoA synthetase
VRNARCAPGRREIAEFSKEFKGFERPRAFALIPKEFTTEDDLLTPSLKVKRRNVVARYKDVLEGLYSSPPPRSDDGMRSKAVGDAGDEARA